MSDVEKLKIDDKIIFYTKNIMSISDKVKRVKRHFILLNKMEKCMYNDYTIAHKRVFVKLDNNKMYIMDFSLLYLNCVLWLFNVTFNIPITDDDLYDMTKSNKNTYTSIMNKIISKFLKLGCNLNKFNVGIIKEKLIKIAIFYGEIYANTFSLYDIMALEDRSPEFSELFNTKLNPEMSSNDIENYLALATEKLYKLIENDKKNSLYPFLTTNMVKKLQIEQMFIAVVARQVIDKSILPIVIKQGWIHGIHDISEFFVESVATRNTIIVKKEAVPESGYLSRKVNIACLNTELDSEIFDCGTTHYLEYYVKNEAYLKLIEGKYMLIDENGPILKEVHDSDTHLIGQMIKLRSHTKCITGHLLNKVCCVCLGNKHSTLKNARIGGLVSIILINPITQLGMSVKHAQSTKSQEISGNVINHYFTVLKSNMFPRKNIKGQLLIKLEIINDIISAECNVDSSNFEQGLDYTKNIDMILVEEDGVLRGLDVEDKNFYVNLSDSLISFISNRTNEIIRIEDIVNTIFDIETTNDINWEVEFAENEYVAINLEELDSSEPIFNIKILTEEVSRHLKNTKIIIDGCKTPTYKRPEDIITDFIEVLFNAGLGNSGSIIHIETLIMNLMRSENSIMEKVNYSTKKEPKIQLVKLTQAIQKSDLFSTLCFQDISRQLELVDTLNKNKPGIFDCFFKNSEFIKNSKYFRKTRPYLFKK